MRQTVASHQKFAFTPTFIICSPICPDNRGVVLEMALYTYYWIPQLYPTPMCGANCKLIDICWRLEDAGKRQNKINFIF